MSDEKKKEIKTINDLREILIDEIQNLRDGLTTPATINAITNATGKIFSSVKLEMEYAKLKGKKPGVKLLEEVDQV